MVCTRSGFDQSLHSRLFHPVNEDRRVVMDVRQLQGHLYVPSRTTGIVVIADAFPHSGLRAVTRSLESRLRGPESRWDGSNLGICQIALLDKEELGQPLLQNDVPLLADRFVAVLQYLKKQRETAHFPIALVGSQMAGVAAMVAAAGYPEWVRAVVCVAGNPNGATTNLARMVTPTILVVPSKSDTLLQSNQQAFWKLRCASQLAVIRDASPRFAELESLLACRNVVAQWCVRYLKRGSRRAAENTEKKRL